MLAWGRGFLCGVVLLGFPVQACQQCWVSRPVGLCCEGWHQRGNFPPPGCASQPQTHCCVFLLEEDQTPQSDFGPAEVEQNMGPAESWGVLPWMSLSSFLTGVSCSLRGKDCSRITYPVLSAAGATSLRASSKEEFGDVWAGIWLVTGVFHQCEAAAQLLVESITHLFIVCWGSSSMRFRRWISSQPCGFLCNYTSLCPSIVAEHLVLHVALLVVVPFF